MVLYCAHVAFVIDETGVCFCASAGAAAKTRTTDNKGGVKFFMAPNEAVEKAVLRIFERRKSLILLASKLARAMFLGFFYSLNVLVDLRHWRRCRTAC
jgi:hypothetical protein